MTSDESNLAKGSIATTRLLRVVAAGYQHTTPAADECKHSSAGTLHPPRIGPILYNRPVHVPSKLSPAGGFGTPILYKVSSAHKSLHSKRHLDRFGRFCKGEPPETSLTRRHTDHVTSAYQWAAAHLSMHRVQAMRPNSQFTVHIARSHSTRPSSCVVSGGANWLQRGHSGRSVNADLDVVCVMALLLLLLLLHEQWSVDVLRLVGRGRRGRRSAVTGRHVGSRTCRPQQVDAAVVAAAAAIRRRRRRGRRLDELQLTQHVRHLGWCGAADVSCWWW